MQCASNVAQDTLQDSKVRLTRIMHVQANLLNGISDIRPGEGEVLQSTGETPEVGGILNRWTISRQLGVGVHRSRARLALGRTCAAQNVKHVLPLREKKSGATPLYMHPQEVMEFPQILHAELLLQGLNGALEDSW